MKRLYLFPVRLLALALAAGLLTFSAFAVTTTTPATKHRKKPAVKAGVKTAARPLARKT